MRKIIARLVHMGLGAFGGAQALATALPGDASSWEQLIAGATGVVAAAVASAVHEGEAKKEEREKAGGGG